MPRILLVMFAATFVLVSSACRSSDKKDEAAQVKEAEPAAEGTKADASTETKADGKGQPKVDECATQPDFVMCCEAMTPSCNDCRDKAKKVQADWAAKCVKPTEAPKDCATPPVSDCCSEAIDACRQCREAAIIKLVAWKEHCASSDSLSCDQKPALAECCAASIPSCDTCRDRNQRLQDDWDRRCK